MLCSLGRLASFLPQRRDREPRRYYPRTRQMLSFLHRLIRISSVRRCDTHSHALNVCHHFHSSYGVLSSSNVKQQWRVIQIVESERPTFLVCHD